jgi:hypothetical protein
MPVDFQFEEEEAVGTEEEKAGDAPRLFKNQLLERLEALNGIDNSIQAEKRLGVYNQAQRVERLNAYRQKRQQRGVKDAKVRYVVRQKASETRVRVHGRFAVSGPDVKLSEAMAAAGQIAPPSMMPPVPTPKLHPAAVAAEVKREPGLSQDGGENWFFDDQDDDHPDKLMRRAAASSASLSWIVDHHRRASAMVSCLSKIRIGFWLGLTELVFN